jgi:hypothetical protein
MSDPDDRPPDFGLADVHEVGPAHIGYILFIFAVAAWYGTDEHSSTLDWVGFALFLAGSLLWALDPPPKLHFENNQGTSLVIGAAGMAYGWWSQRLPIAIAGALLAAFVSVIRFRRMRSR